MPWSHMCILPIQRLPQKVVLIPNHDTPVTQFERIHGRFNKPKTSKNQGYDQGPPYWDRSREYKAATTHVIPLYWPKEVGRLHLGSGFGPEFRGFSRSRAAASDAGDPTAVKHAGNVSGVSELTGMGQRHRGFFYASFNNLWIQPSWTNTRTHTN